MVINSLNGACQNNDTLTLGISRPLITCSKAMHSVHLKQHLELHINSAILTSKMVYIRINYQCSDRQKSMALSQYYLCCNSVWPSREQFRDASRLEAEVCQTKRSPQSGPASTHHNSIILMVDDRVVTRNLHQQNTLTTVPAKPTAVGRRATRLTIVNRRRPLPA